MLIDFIISIPGPLYLFIFIILCILLFIVTKIILKYDGTIKNSLPTHFEAYEIAYIRGGIRAVIDTAIFSLVGKQKIEIIGDIVYISGDDAELDKIERKVFHFFQKNSKLNNIFFSKIFGKNIKTSLSAVIHRLEKIELIENKRLRMKRYSLLFVDYILLFIIGGTKIYFGLVRGKPTIFLIFLFIVSLIIFYRLIFKKNRRITELGKLYLKTIENNLSHIKTKIISRNYNVDTDIPLAFAIFGAGIFITTPPFVELSTKMQFIESIMASKGGGDGCGGCSGCSGGSCSGCGGCGGGD